MKEPAVLARDLYLDLLRDVLINKIYDDPSINPVKKTSIRRILGMMDGTLDYKQEARERGMDWPSVAHSMIGAQRMENLRQCVTHVIEDEIPGDLAETGVWRGGACIMMRGVLKAYAVTDRKVWVADSFAGLPKPKSQYNADKADEHHKYDVLAVSQEQVAENFERYGLLDSQVCFLKGWFKETLPTAKIDRLAVLRLDGDMYESTTDAMEALYDKVSPGGFVIVDDYVMIQACREAVHDYLGRKNEKPEIKQIDGVGVFWRKS